MYLSQLKLWNFRKFGQDSLFDLNSPHLAVNFDKGLNVLVGENDSGKTCIIDAIKVILKTHSFEWIKIEDDDFYKKSNRLRIECLFRELKDNEAKNFLEWLAIEKVSTEAGMVDVPYLRLILDVKRTSDQILSYEVTAGPDADGRQLNAEAKEFLKTTYLKPLRDAETELVSRKNSRLSQILDGHVVFKDKESHALIRILSGANKEIKGFFEDESKKHENGFRILETLQRYLSKFLHRNSTQKTKFHIDNPKLKNILEILKLTLDDELSGLGTYNLLFIAAELLHLRKENYDGLKLGLIEEIEAHLHPQAQLRVLNALKEESQEGDVQLILTTHSPNLGSIVRINNIILCDGIGAYSLGTGYTKLKPTDYNFLERFLDATRANLFFAKGVLLVEGDAENLLIPTIARLIKKDLAEHGVSIVNVGSTAFLRYAHIFQRVDTNEKLNIPVSVITDLDVKPDNENDQINGSNRKTKVTSDKESKYNGYPVKTFVSPHWTLEYCLGLSTYLRQLLFEAIKSAGEEMHQDGYSGRRVSETWENFTRESTAQNVAKKIYDLILTKEISKAIVAQHLAEKLESKKSDHSFCDQLASDESITYIIQAINYATSA